MPEANVPSPAHLPAPELDATGRSAPRKAAPRLLPVIGVGYGLA
jgi:hypothetical protein